MSRLTSLLLALLPFGSVPQAPTASAPPTTARAEAPRLVVLVVIDQLIPEQLDRLEPWLEGGLGRFVHQGQVWRRGEHRHGGTQTGPGHATIGTAMDPSRHGIAANSWASATGEVYCCADPEALTITSSGPRADAGRSPALLLAPSLGDHLHAASPGGKMVGIAGKDRAAVLTSGGAADGVFWWDRAGAGFVSSSAYGDELPAWVTDWNDGWPATFIEGDGYVWSDTLPEGAAARGTAPDERPGENPLRGSIRFPHEAPRAAEGWPTEQELAGFASWTYTTPLLDHFVIELALHAVDAYELGADDSTDALFVGLSACDTVGHSFGPYSREVTDVVLRADRELERLFRKLDEQVGAGRWVAALSADHGVLALPESLAAGGYDAGRPSGQDLNAAYRDARAALTERFGQDFVLEASSRGVLLDHEALAAAGVDGALVRRAMSDAAVSVPWVARAYTCEDLLAPDVATDPLLLSMSRSYVAGRSPDVTLVARPWQVLGWRAGTSHGSPYDYDRHVPIAFYGANTPHAERFDPCATVDVVPTLFARAGLAPPTDVDGRPLE